MRVKGGTATKINRGAAILSNKAAGEVTYQWGTADTDTSGSYESEVEIVWTDGKSETFPGGPSGGNYWDVTITGDIA